MICYYSEHLACPEHGVSLPEIEPRTFSFNTPHGACPDCEGLGSKLEIDPDLLIPDRERSLNDGAIIAMEWNNGREQGGYYWQMLEAVASQFDIKLDKPVSEIPEEKLHLILYGTGKQEVTMNMVGRNNDRQTTFETSFEGVIPNLERRFRETSSEFIRSRIGEYMSDRPCPTCKGTRLRPEALAVTVDEKNIVEVTGWPVISTLNWIIIIDGKGDLPEYPPENDRRTGAERDPGTIGIPGGCWIGLPYPAKTGWIAFRR